MTGKYLKEKSWAKQSFFLLDNGFVARVESSIYGDLIAAIETETGEILYHASNGHDIAPDWLKAWIKPIGQGHWQTVIYADFKRIWK